VSPDRRELHERAAAAVAKLVARFGTSIPDDAETVVRYYRSCENAYDRAAADVVRLEPLVAGRPARS
jgi:hypothetical protein